MTVFTPRSRQEIYFDMKNQILAFTPLVSAEIGEVIDQIIFAVTDQIYEAYVEMQNALLLLSLDTVTGADLDTLATQYPNLTPRFQQTNAVGQIQITDPSITVIQTTIAPGGATHGTNTLNVNSTTGFPSTGTLLVGTRGQSNYETVSYTSYAADQFQLSSNLQYDHASNEPIFLTTVGDRSFTGPYSASTIATTSTAAQVYTTTGSFVIYDGQASGLVDVEANTAGPAGNTSDNTVTKFIGPPPFVGATVTNPASISGGSPVETDVDFRARIRAEIQSLSSANIDSISSALFGFTYNGDKIVFAQEIEDPDPTLPTLIYIDDGSAFTPSQANLSSPIVLVYSANGGETHFRVPVANLPIVKASLSENTTRIFSNITLQLNGVTMVQGDSAGQYRVQPDSGLIRLNTPLNLGDNLQITALTYYTGLFAQANLVLYGDRNNRTQYPGAVGLGQWIQLIVPSVTFINITMTITIDGTVNKQTCINNIMNNLIAYINGLGIANSVILAQIINLSMVPGVSNVTITSPSSPITQIGPGGLARTTSGNISIS